MIATLTGTVADKLDHALIVECGGVGYGVSVSDETHGRLNSGEETKLYIYEHIREDNHDLYGFGSLAEKKFFEQLLGVNGVGPKMALSIMNLGSSGDVSNAIATGNIAYLTRASGVGRRLAERLVVDLKDSFAEASLLKRVASKTNDDALQALLALGYSQAQALTALAETNAKETEEQVKEALKVLSK